MMVSGEPAAWIIKRVNNKLAKAAPIITSVASSIIARTAGFPREEGWELKEGDKILMLALPEILVE